MNQMTFSFPRTDTLPSASDDRIFNNYSMIVVKTGDTIWIDYPGDFVWFNASEIAGSPVKIILSDNFSDTFAAEDFAGYDKGFFLSPGGSIGGVNYKRIGIKNFGFSGNALVMVAKSQSPFPIRTR